MSGVTCLCGCAQIQNRMLESLNAALFFCYCSRKYIGVGLVSIKSLSFAVVLLFIQMHTNV